MASVRQLIAGRDWYNNDASPADALRATFERDPQLYYEDGFQELADRGGRVHLEVEQLSHLLADSRNAATVRFEGTPAVALGELLPRGAAPSRT